MQRRDFFGLTAAAISAQTLLAAPGAGDDEHYWESIRDEFTIDRTVINFNSGYMSPCPRVVQDAVKRYLDFTNMGPYHTMVRELYPRVESARRAVAEAAGVDPEEIALTRNSSEALEIAQMGLNLKAGDEVVTTNQDYPRMLTTFAQRARRDGIKVKQISFPVPVVSADDLYERFEKAITPATKAILVCHITNRTGVIFPVRRIADMAHARGITVIVDGAHAFSQFPFKLSDLGADYYGVSLHKWTYAPCGSGFLYVNKARIKETWPLMAAGPNQDVDVRKFEEIGTHPAANFNAICEASDFNRNMGIARKAARLRFLRDRWAEPLAKNPKLKVLHSAGSELSAGIGMLGLSDPKGSDERLRKLTTALETKHRIYTAFMGHEEYNGIRITPNVYSTVEEVDRFVEAVEKEMKSI